MVETVVFVCVCVSCILLSFSFKYHHLVLIVGLFVDLSIMGRGGGGGVAAWVLGAHENNIRPNGHDGHRGNSFGAQHINVTLDASPCGTLYL